MDWGVAGPLVEAAHRRARNAFHEAGHAVVARGCGIGVRDVSIVDDGHSGGRTHIGPGGNVWATPLASWSAGLDRWWARGSTG